MNRSAPYPWKLPAALAVALLAGAVLGWLAGGHVTAAIAVVALAEIVLLLTPFGHTARLMMRAPAPINPIQHDRFMTRSRRLASNLRDLRNAASQLPDAVVLIDQKQNIRWFNHSAENLLGLQRPRDRGAPLQQRLAGSALSDWLREGAVEPLNDAAAPGQANSHINVSLLPFGEHEQLLLARDISHLSRLEQVRRDFVANVSHELRTPLTVIHGYLELIDPEDVPELAAVISEMRAQSKRMGQIVEDLLTLSRLETQHAVADERVPMSGLLATIRKEAEALSQGRHTIRLDASTDADLLGSAKDLHSALSNLVSNAVRYTPAGGSITIRWKRTPDGAVYSVSDTGFGIPASHLARLTERFYRISSSRSRDSGGTGLGLSIVKHVLNLHQAQLQIESTPGAGSTFSCHFTAARVLAPATSDES
ncbi:MAG: phosphate regulon sensor histidine kinase PhoR [Pseudomonadota bacterium]|jgi:two-component system phosphate regulon sensor histidine kinase PhoR|nr:phosphate regulon sensor histidine kinase PhoR [Xanthomonadaceae bacterium]MDE3210401.1 phosphate regulon sensor histidine kinase PhoR [Pseudomonadota bacterium]